MRLVFRDCERRETAGWWVRRSVSFTGTWIINSLCTRIQKIKKKEMIKDKRQRLRRRVIKWRDINAAVLLLWMGWSTLGGDVQEQCEVGRLPCRFFVKGWIWIWLFSNTLSLGLSLLWELASRTYRDNLPKGTLQVK